MNKETLNKLKDLRDRLKQTPIAVWADYYEVVANVINDAERTTSPVATTPSTASQAPAVSIHCQEFHELAMDYRGAQVIGVTAEAYAKLVEYIDAKLAQASNDSSSKGRIYQRKVDEKITERWKARATAAEAKLEAIRQNLENLDRYDADYQRGDGVWLVVKGAYIDRADALALFKPQPQADESGLPG